MKNRIIALIMSIVLILPCGTVFAGVSEDKVPEILEALDIIPSTTVVTDELITRGEFAILAAKLINIGDITNLPKQSKFSDLSEEHPCYDSVNLLYQMNIIHGIGNSEFKPDEPIRLNDACKILIHIMGYQYLTVKDNYIVVATRRKLLNDISLESQNFTYKTALKLIYNTLEADISDSNSVDGMSSGRYDEIFMTKRLGIHKIEGLVTDDGVVSLFGESNIKEGRILVGGKVFLNETGNNDLLGYKIEGFYKENTATDEDIMIFAYIRDPEKTLVTLNADTISKYSNHTYEYYPDTNTDKVKRINIDPNYKLVYNGVLFKAEDALPTFALTVEQMMTPTTGEVRLINSDNDGDFDIVSVMDLTSYIVSSINYDDCIIYGRSNITPGIVDLSSAKDSIVVKSPNGARTEFSKILVDNVVSVGLSADGKHAEIVLAESKKTGALQSIYNDCYIIDGNEYEFSPEYIAYNSNGKKPAPGTDIEYYLTYEGKIIFTRKAGELNAIYARLTGFSGDLEGFNSNLSLQLYLENNSCDYYELAEKVNIDGIRFKNDPEAVYNYLAQENDFTANGEYSGIILVRINKDNKIDFIDTPYKESLGNPNVLTEGNDTLHILKNGERTGARYFHTYFSFSGKWVGTADSKYVIIGEQTSEPENDMIFTTLTDPIANVNNQFVDMVAFATKANSNIAEVIVRFRDRYEGNLSGSVKFYVILGVSTALNKNDDIVKLVTVTDGKVIKDYYTESEETLICKCGSTSCTETPLIAEAGDIVKMTLSNNIIPDGGIFVAYDYSEDRQWIYGDETVHDFADLDNNGINDTSKISLSKFHFYSLLRGYLNTLDFETAQWIVDYYPYYTTNETVVDTGKQYSIYNSVDYPFVTTLRDAYTIEVDVDRGIMIPKLTSEIMQYNDGDGVIQKVFLLQQNGSPYCIVTYAQ